MSVSEESAPEDEDQWLLKIALHSKNNLAICGHRSDFGLWHNLTSESSAIFLWKYCFVRVVVSTYCFAVSVKWEKIGAANCAKSV